MVLRGLHQVHGAGESWQFTQDLEAQVSDKSSIEWTDATCPLYNPLYGTDTRGREKDRSGTNRMHGRGVRPAHISGPQVVRHLQGVAGGGDVRPRFVALGRACVGVYEGTQSGPTRPLHAESQTEAGTQLCTASRWRLQAGAPPRELLRRDRADAESELAAVHRLRSRMATGREAARV